MINIFKSIDNKGGDIQKVIIIVFATLLLLVGLSAGTQAVTASLNTSIEIVAYNNFTILSTSQSQDQLGSGIQFPDDFLMLNVTNPKETYYESFDWSLETNNGDMTLTFTSIGYDENDEIGSLTEENIRNFVLYTVADTSSQIQEDFQPGGSVSDIMFHSGTFRIKYDPGLTDLLWCANRAGKYRDIILVTISEIPSPDEETAFGGDTGINVGEPGAWWYYFDTEGPSTQTIWAGQTINVGEVTVTKTNDDWNIKIELKNGWQLKNVSEPVKIQGYQANNLPETRPAAGLFAYKGDALNVTISDNNYRYFVIHLDVIK